MTIKIPPPITVETIRKYMEWLESNGGRGYGTPYGRAETTKYLNRKRNEGILQELSSACDRQDSDVRLILKILIDEILLPPLNTK